MSQFRSDSTSSHGSTAAPSGPLRAPLGRCTLYGPGLCRPNLLPTMGHPMNEPTGPRFDDLAPALARRLDAICRRCEADRRADRRPSIDDYLADVPDEGRSALRAEL